ncbi:MAG: N-acetyltransferase [Clostridia bacterium]|nr:N-acetyltransferase [Clostridia bacterium]
MIEIRETGINDLEDVRRLWADGDVMLFVGFPEGLHKTDEEMLEWYRRVDRRRPDINHYSVFEDGVYCGESYYRIDREHGNSAAMDVKLFGTARGRGIAAAALSHAIREAFDYGAETVWVDPVPANAKAIALYERLGFKKAERPGYLITDGEAPGSVYMELRKERS